MKNIIRVLSLVFTVVLLSGCGVEEKEVTKTCTLTTNDVANGYKLEAVYKVYGKGKNVEKVETIETITSSDEESLASFEDYFKESYESVNEVYGGYTNKVTNENGKVISETTIDYNEMDVEQYVKDNSSMKQYVTSDNKISVNGIISIYEALGATCE